MALSYILQILTFPIFWWNYFKLSFTLGFHDLIYKSAAITVMMTNILAILIMPARGVINISREKFESKPGIEC